MFSVVGLVSASFLAFSLSVFASLQASFQNGLLRPFCAPFGMASLAARRTDFKKLLFSSSRLLPSGFMVLRTSRKAFQSAFLWHHFGCGLACLARLCGRSQIIGRWSADILACLPAGPDVLCYVSGADGEVGG